MYVVFSLKREANDKDIFVDILSGITAAVDVEWEGWTFANLSVETLAECVVDTSRLPTCESVFTIAH